MSEHRALTGADLAAGQARLAGARGGEPDRAGLTDLLVSTHTPIVRSGQTMRTYGLARALAAAGGGLTLLYARFEGEQPDEAFTSIPGIELREVRPTRGPRRLLAYRRARALGVPPGFARGISAELRGAAAELARAPNRGRVIADGPIAAAAMLSLARRRALVYNAHNFESGFRAELVGAGEARRLRRFEHRVLSRFAESWMVSEADLAAAAELCPGARLRYVPNVVDVAAIPARAEPPAAPEAVFVASFAYPPNRNGLRFLLEEVYPRVWEQLSEARLTLVGGGLQEPPSADPRVRAVGFVDDLTAAYGRARCALVPLLQSPRLRRPGAGDAAGRRRAGRARRGRLPAGRRPRGVRGEARPRAARGRRGDRRAGTHDRRAPLLDRGAGTRALELSALRGAPVRADPRALPPRLGADARR